MIHPEDLKETGSVSNRTGKIYNPVRISNTLAGRGKNRAKMRMKMRM